MSRVRKKQQKKLKPGEKRRRRQIRKSFDDQLAMIAADVDANHWALMSDFQRQLFRVKAQQAMSVLFED